MTLARITGPMLQGNLERLGTNLSVDAAAYFDVNNYRLGINNNNPQYTLDATGNAHLGNLYILGNTITTDPGYKLNLGNLANITISGGLANYILYTDGNGNLNFGDLDSFPEAAQINANIATANASILALQANVGSYYAWANANVAGLYNSIQGANASIQSLSANVGSYYTWANANVAGLYNSIQGANTTISTLQANVGSYYTWANANVAGLYNSIQGANTSIQSLSANVGAYETWANANVAGLYNSIQGANAAIANTSASLLGNAIILGSNSVQAFTSNAVTLTSTTSVTNAISELNYVLGKLVPPAPPNFPNSESLALTSSTSPGLMCNFTQTDNSGWGNLSVAGGTSVNAVRSSLYTTAGSPITNVGPGSIGVVTAYLNNHPAGNVTLTGTNTDTTNGNLFVYSVQDYHNVISTVTPGFWTCFNTYALGSAPAGWNTVCIGDTATGANTNIVKWYYDNSSPAAPVFSATSFVLSSNVVQYSSTIPMFTTSAGWTIKGNVTNLSGDTYYNSTNLFYSESAGGAFNTPAQVSLSSAGITTPMPRNSTAVAQFTTTSNIVSGFGLSASGGPSVTVYNNYNTGSQSFTQANIILYKTGTGNQIEETSITNSYTGANAAYRIVNPDAGSASDNPVYTGNEAAFNSITGPFYTTDATNVASTIQFDQTNYSTGYLPIGPNLSGHSSTQYFTFKWTKSAVSKFNISYTGTIAGLWVALPGSIIDTTAAPTNGWINMAVYYIGSGVPGSGSGGNGSVGCSTGGSAVLNVNGSYNVTCTFGTASSTNSTSNEIYVRVKLTSGQSLTALSIGNPTN